ncbi:MAG: hypothetical protein KJO75_06830 [Dactylosporangium sp.]|nr:hypothetical protein [Dactylosporangium sp.]
MMAIICAGVGSFGLLLASPVIMARLYWWLSEPLVGRMSDIGQSYGGLSAILSAGAMIGVIAALLMQIRQIRIGQAQGMRMLQIELMSMLLRDPNLRPVSPSYRLPDPSRRQRDIFSNLIFKYLELGYETGYFPRDSIRLEFSQQFEVDDIRRFWANIREAYAGGVCNEAQRRFVELVNTAYEEVAMTKAPPAVSPEGPSSRIRDEAWGPSWRSVSSMRLAFTGVVAAAGILAAVRSRKRSRTMGRATSQHDSGSARTMPKRTR